jgi:hypothetical protein
MELKIRKYIAKNIISIIALMISIGSIYISIYYSIFYKDNNLELSILDSYIDPEKSVITVDILYNNKGNVYKTVIDNSIKLFQIDSSIWHGERLPGLDPNAKPDHTAPLIIKPGEQIFQRLTLNIRQLDSMQRQPIESKFDRFMMSRPIDFQKNINVGIALWYLNEKGNKTDEVIPIGNFILDKDKEITKYNFRYQVLDLNSKGYNRGEEMQPLPAKIKIHKHRPPDTIPT